MNKSNYPTCNLALTTESGLFRLRKGFIPTGAKGQHDTYPIGSEEGGAPKQHPNCRRRSTPHAAETYSPTDVSSGTTRKACGVCGS